VTFFSPFFVAGEHAAGVLYGLVRKCNPEEQEPCRQHKVGEGRVIMFILLITVVYRIK
jgi:hypothetical protein